VAGFVRMGRGVAEEGIYRVENHRHSSSSAIAGESAVVCMEESVLVEILLRSPCARDAACTIYTRRVARR